MEKFIPIIIDILGVITGAGMVWVIYQHNKQNKRAKGGQAQKKNPVKISNNEADFQRWKKERENT